MVTGRETAGGGAEKSKGNGGFFTSVGVLSAARAAALASQVLVLPILARHLDPAEFGIAALAVSVAVFANLFSDAGMGRSLIRTPLSAAEEWSSVFWFLGVLGLALSLVLFTLTPVAVWFFEEPSLFWPLCALAPLPCILSFNAAFAAEMEQRKAFSELALSQVIATAVSVGAAAYLAVAEYGVWALVVQQLLMIGVKAVWIFARSKFRPDIFFSFNALDAHFKFGRDITAASIVSYLNQQMTILVIGKVLGTAELGLFAMVQRFTRLPMFGLAGPAGQVLYVRLSQAKDDPVAFRDLVAASIRLLGFVALPGVAAIALVGETAFVLILSDRWAAVAPLFLLAAGGAALRAATHPTAIALAALGRTGDRLRLTVEILLVWLVLLAGAVFIGLWAIAAAQTVWMLVQLPRHWHYLDQACGLGARAFLMALLPGTVAMGFIAIAIAAAALAPGGDWTWLALSALASTFGFGATVLIFRVRLKRDLTLLQR